MHTENDENELGRPAVICLTPVKNESWILEKFLEAATLWADHIIVADQMSEDNSCEIASKFPKVRIIKNHSIGLNESERQKLLIDAAREIDGPKLLIALDADEFLTGNFNQSLEWRHVKAAPPGSVVTFKCVNIRPGLQKYWTPEKRFPWGFVDDGSDHSGALIHSNRIPVPKNSMIIALNEVKVMHFQYVDWERMSSKHRWYQCWEMLNRNNRRPIDIYEQYHHMYEVDDTDVHDMKNEWFSFYLDNGIDLHEIEFEGVYWWDKEVLSHFQHYGMRRFRKLDIWDVDWIEKAKFYKINDAEKFSDPRNWIDRNVLRWLKTGLRNRNKYLTRKILKILKLFGW